MMLLSPAVRLLCGALLGSVLAAGTLSAQETEKPAEAKHAQSTRQPSARADRLEQRVQLLTRELDLDLEQQGAVREVLRSQREAVKRIWEDTAISPAERAPAVRLVGERAADQIRAQLNEEQRKKYNRPLPDGALSTQANADVDGWLRATRGDSQENPLGVSLPSSQAAQPGAP